jgi:hypothetical protein
MADSSIYVNYDCIKWVIFHVFAVMINDTVSGSTNINASGIKLVNSITCAGKKFLASMQDTGFWYVEGL